MNKFLLLITFFLAGLFLSGCSLNPASQKNGSGNIASVFNQASVKGSLWKTSDGGHSFEVKSAINEKSMISNADILSIAYHPKKEMVIIVSSVESGIFKTENGGDSWIPIDFPPKKIYSFILDKNDPDNTMFASGVVDDWGKIFRTKDGGKNWEIVYTEPGQKTVIKALSQHPKDANIIFAGTSDGAVIKSLDAGNTWMNIGDKIEGTISDITFDSNKNLATYLLSYNSKFYYSENGGKIWADWDKEKQVEIELLNKKITEAYSKRKISTGDRLRKEADALSKRNETNKMPIGIVSIAADPFISGTVYAGTNNGLFKSTDYGKYWFEVNIIESAKKFPIRSISVNPKNSNEIVFVSGKAFYKSLDKGITWAISGLNVDRDAAFVSYDPFNSDYLFIGLRKF